VEEGGATRQENRKTKGGGDSHGKATLRREPWPKQTGGEKKGRKVHEGGRKKNQGAPSEKRGFVPGRKRRRTSKRSTLKRKIPIGGGGSPEVGGGGGMERGAVRRTNVR